MDRLQWALLAPAEYLFPLEPALRARATMLLGVLFAFFARAVYNSLHVLLMGRYARRRIRISNEQLLEEELLSSITSEAEALTGEEHAQQVPSVGPSRPGGSRAVPSGGGDAATGAPTATPRATKASPGYSVREYICSASSRHRAAPIEPSVGPTRSTDAMGVSSGGHAATGPQTSISRATWESSSHSYQYIPLAQRRPAHIEFVPRRQSTQAAALGNFAQDTVVAPPWGHIRRTGFRLARSTGPREMKQAHLQPPRRTTPTPPAQGQARSTRSPTTAGRFGVPPPRTHTHSSAPPVATTTAAAAWEAFRAKQPRFGSTTTTTTTKTTATALRVAAAAARRGARGGGLDEDRRSLARLEANRQKRRHMFATEPPASATLPPPTAVSVRRESGSVSIVGSGSGSGLGSISGSESGAAVAPVASVEALEKEAAKASVSAVEASAAAVRAMEEIIAAGKAAKGARERTDQMTWAAMAVTRRAAVSRVAVGATEGEEEVAVARKASRARAVAWKVAEEGQKDEAATQKALAWKAAAEADVAVEEEEMKAAAATRKACALRAAVEAAAEEKVMAAASTMAREALARTAVAGAAAGGEVALALLSAPADAMEEVATCQDEQATAAEGEMVKEQAMVVVVEAAMEPPPPAALDGSEEAKESVAPAPRMKKFSFGTGQTQEERDRSCTNPPFSKCGWISTHNDL